MKRKLLRVIGISFLIFTVLSWLIPAGTYSGGKLETTSISPVGLISLINAPISAFVTFSLYGVVFAVIGGFYGVLEKTLVLDSITDRWAVKYEGKETRFLVITMILFILLSSLTGLVLPLFILVPLYAMGLFKMNYDKMTVMASTVGSILVGSIGSTYGFNITGYTKNLLSLDMNNQIWARVIILVLITIAFIFTVVFLGKKSDNSKQSNKSVSTKDSKINDISKVADEEPKKAEKEDSKARKTSKSSSKKTNKKSTKDSKSSKKTSKSNTKALAVIEPVKKVSEKSMVNNIPFKVIFALMFLVAIVGMYNWYYSFGIELFNNMYDAVMGVKIKGFAIFEKIFSESTQFGYWSNIEFAGLTVFTSMVIAWLYKVSFNDFVESFIAGVKKWLPTAVYAALASVILAVLYQALQTGQGTMVDTIFGVMFGWVDGFNPIITGFAALIGSFFYNDLYYLLADMSSFVTGFDSSALSVAGVLIQSAYSVGMMIFPTSVVLVAGLSLFDISYGKWMKYIWRFALISLLLVLLVCGILSLL